MRLKNLKLRILKVIGLLAELSVRKTKLVDKTPFNNFENDIVLQVIDNRLNEIYAIVQNDP